ncbi:hypothetical protein HJG60_009741 [Phyllostomus discolor]|uniref:Uncharacterized protein n=1 Tax=Phyllostomus discolor TaxID=89673 RepID=A0A834B6P3_9CHIR|nr:hypothetical protein HJG60_009741 [Phyllostomus discolor]
MLFFFFNSTWTQTKGAWRIVHREFLWSGPRTGLYHLYPQPIGQNSVPWLPPNCKKGNEMSSVLHSRGEKEIDFGEHVKVSTTDGKILYLKNTSKLIISKVIYLSILNLIIPFDLETLLLEDLFNGYSPVDPPDSFSTFFHLHYGLPHIVTSAWIRPMESTS